MEITAIRFDNPPQRPGSDPALLGFADLTFDDTLDVRGVRLIALPDGRPLAAMPSREPRRPCHCCGGRVPRAAAWCPWCGVPLPPPLGMIDRVDVVHPTSAAARERFTRVIFDAASLHESKNGTTMVRIACGIPRRVAS